MLHVAVDVSETVVEVDDGFSVGLRAAASPSGARVLGTRGAGSEAGRRRRACMYDVVPHLPSPSTSVQGRAAGAPCVRARACFAIVPSHTRVVSPVIGPVAASQALYLRMRAMERVVMCELRWHAPVGRVHRIRDAQRY